MQTVILALNPLEPETWTRHEVEDVRPFLREQFAEWPQTARIYHNEVAQTHDVTPATPGEVDRLATLDGTLYIVLYPGGIEWLILAAVAVLVVAAAVFLRPIPAVAQRNTQSQSPNNALSERTNQARPKGRIPDIYGQVRSTPDLVAVPYKIFRDNKEIEVSYMCVGRGSYDVADIRDDTTLLTEIDGASAEVYGPNTAPTIGSTPELSIGPAITEPVQVVQRSNGVNGQVLEPSGGAPIYIGPFTLSSATMRRVYANFVCLNGLYKDDGEHQTAASVTVCLGLTPVNTAGDPTGVEEVFALTLTGSASSQSMVAGTLIAEPSFTGRCKARAWRSSPEDTEFDGRVVDEVKWRDLYAMSPAPESHFGDVTTVRSMTYGTEGALAMKERKLNMLVTRKLPAVIFAGGYWSLAPELTGTRNAAAILTAICLDPFIGNRKPEEVDVQNFHGVIGELVEYFGSTVMAEFSYTFDKDGLSFEETLAMVADAIFCRVYRRGSLIKLFFERETGDSVLLFNHRNKLPGTETRTVSFGLHKGYDGIEYEYVSPVDDAVVTFYIPEDQSALNAQKIESVGVRSTPQAYVHAWRAWNKLQYQNVATEFEATQEADMLIIGNRLLASDNTRPDTYDGEIRDHSVLSLELSQAFTPSNPEDDFVIFLQHADGTVESRNIVNVLAGGLVVVIDEAPSQALKLEHDDYARTRYVITGAANTSPTAFLLSEKEPQDGFSVKLTAVNYDARYYEKDKDFAGYITPGEGETPPGEGDPPPPVNPDQPAAVTGFTLSFYRDATYPVVLVGDCSASSDSGLGGYALYVSRVNGFTPTGTPDGISSTPRVESGKFGLAGGVWYGRMAAYATGWSGDPAALNFSAQYQVYANTRPGGDDLGDNPLTVQP